MVGVETLLGERCCARWSSKESDCTIDPRTFTFSGISARCNLFAQLTRCYMTRRSPSVANLEQIFSSWWSHLSKSRGMSFRGKSKPLHDQGRILKTSGTCPFRNQECDDLGSKVKLAMLIFISAGDKTRTVGIQEQGHPKYRAETYRVVDTSVPLSKARPLDAKSELIRSQMALTLQDQETCHLGSRSKSFTRVGICVPIPNASLANVQSDITQTIAISRGIKIRVIWDQEQRFPDLVALMSRVSKQTSE